jgi:hypothetical protein
MLSYRNIICVEQKTGRIEARSVIVVVSSARLSGADRVIGILGSARAVGSHWKLGQLTAYTACDRRLTFAEPAFQLIISVHVAIGVNI